MSSSAAGGSSSSLGAITAVTFSPDGKRLAVGTYGEVVLYDTATWQPCATFMQVEDSVRALAYLPDGKTLAVGSGLPARDGKVEFWDTVSGATRLFPSQKDSVEAIAIRADGKAMLVAADDNKAHYYANLPYGFGPTLDEHNGRVLAAAFPTKPDTVFVTGAMDKIVKVWDAKTHQTVVNFDQSEGGITGLAFLPSGTQIVGSSLDGRLYWWQISYNERKRVYSGSHYRTVGAHTDGVLAMSISADGQRLITGGEDHRVRIWKADDGGRVRLFKDFTQPVYAVALNADGKIAAAGGREGVVRLWDVEANKPIVTLTPPPLPKTKPAVKKTKAVLAANKRK